MIVLFKQSCAYLLARSTFALLVTMSGNTAAAQHDLAPHNRVMETECSNDVSEKKIEFDVRDAANNIEKNIIKDAELENDAHPPQRRAESLAVCPRYIFHVHQCMVGKPRKASLTKLIPNSFRGLTQVFGIFQEIYLTTLLPSTSSSAISWIGSVQCFLVIVLGALTGPLFDAGYLRPLLLLGCFLIVLGMATLSLATAYWHVFLSQGLCVGLGAGLIYVPSLALVITLFPPSTRPWAIGCANSGGSIGGIIFTFMLGRLVPAVGFPWAVRAVALVNFVLSTVALVIILPHRPQCAGRRRAILDLGAFRELSFMLFALALLFNYVAFYIPAFYLPVIATRALGQSQDFAFESLEFVSVGSVFGRTIPMLAASRVGSVQVYLAATLAAVVVLFA